MASDSASFVDAREVLQTIVSRARRIQDELKCKDIEDYLSLMKQFKDSYPHAASDQKFQRRFRTYYRLNSAGLTQDFMAEYFKLMDELPRSKHVDLALICARLKKHRDRQNRESLQFSFCTKLAATLNPKYPIYDVNVAKVFDFDPPRPSLPYEERVRLYLSFYAHIRSTIKWLASCPEIVKINGAQTTKFRQWDALSKTKQVDFLIWTAGKLLRGEKRSTVPL